mmetsp:Transcript_97403/g.191264  ORF Transcript_97403/g.191264 Transcript_97403/m.191264 type:complete len:217 (-) Transcript_97403:155-805(-)
MRPRAQGRIWQLKPYPSRWYLRFQCLCGRLHLLQRDPGAPAIAWILLKHAHQKPPHLRVQCVETWGKVDLEAVADDFPHLLPALLGAVHDLWKRGCLRDDPVHDDVEAERHPGEDEPRAPNVVLRSARHRIHDLRRLDEDGAHTLIPRVPQIAKPGSSVGVRAKYAACTKASDDRPAVKNHNILHGQLAVQNANVLQLLTTAQQVDQNRDGAVRRE